MAGRPEMRFPRMDGGETDGMLKMTGCRLLVAYQTRQNGKTGGIGGCPALGPQRI